MNSNNKTKILLSWSSGKDSAWALYNLQQRDDIELVGLLTSLNVSAGRVSMHAVREQLLEAQAAAAGLPLTKIYLPNPCPNEVYEEKMREAMEQAKADGINTIAFGDLFLEDVRKYREEKLAEVDMEPIFPIWGLDTAKLSRDMVAAGVRAIVTCVDPNKLDPSFVGRIYDNQLLDDLPPDVDPCAENGEFHSCVYAGPMFKEPIPIVPGEVVKRDGFVFADVMLDTK